MTNLSTIIVEELSHYADSSELIKFIATLKNYNIATLQDLQHISIDEFCNYRGVGKTKIEKLQILKALLNDNLERIQESAIVPSLPSAMGESLAADILKFIKEYIALKAHNNEQSNTAKCVELMLLGGYSVENVAINCGKSQERVRQWVIYDTHPSFFAKLRRMAYGNFTESDKPQFVLSSEFKAKLNELKGRVRSGMLKSDMAQIIGLDNVQDKTHQNGVMMFVNTLLGLKEYCGEVHGTRVKNDYLISGDINDVKKVWGTVFKTLDSFVKPCIKEELISLIKRKHSGISRSAIDTIVGIIESDKDLFIVEKEGPATKYQLQWDALQSMQSRIERILYEQQQPVQKQDIKNEYDRRLQIYKLSEPDVFHIKTSKKILHLHQGGTWIWREYADCKDTISRLELVRQYAAQNEVVHLEAVVSYVRTFIPNASERSIRTLLLKCCYATTSDSYIFKGSKTQFPEEQVVTNSDLLPEVVKVLQKGKKYSYQEIRDLYTQQYGYSITMAKIRKICSNKTVFIVETPKSRRRGSLVSINPEWDGRYTKRTLERGIQAEWKKNVREEIINKLRFSSNYEMERSVLCSQIKSFIPDNVSKTGVYKIFKDKIFNIKDTGTEVVVALNIEAWEAEYRQTIEADNASRYEANELSLKEVQQKERHKSLAYNMSRTDKDITRLYALMKSFITHNLNQLEKDDMGIDDIESAWAYMIQQMRVLEHGEENAYYRMLNQLYSYLCLGTTRCDRYYLWLELRLNFEPYLKSLLTLKGFSVYKKDDNKELQLQLKDLIILSQQNGILPVRGRNNISYYIGEILKTRNWKGHNAEDTPNDVEIIKYIQKCITLYLYTSMRFMKMQ